ncbi:MAG: L,D-transpeptidase [Methylococcaceae bacterium]|nr:L,D-transpeptidase [Methylococcaceae bacterium]
MRLFNFLFLLVMFLLSASVFAEAQDIWVLVETEPRLLKVMQGNEEIEIFPRVAIGRHGAGFEKARNDKKTPLGEYRIGWVNENSKFHRFYGVTYPNVENAKRAYREGMIGEQTFRSIMLAELESSIPPQNTPLGGQIGIHGLGAADREIHQAFDWTSGCIALTNEEIDRLSRWLKKGTLVVIR